MNAERTNGPVRFADDIVTSMHIESRRRIAYKDRSQVILIRADGTDARVLCQENGARSIDCPLVWSPDGKTLYHSREQVVGIDVASGQMRDATSFPPEDEFGVHWYLECSPDGRQLCYLHHSGQGDSHGNNLDRQHQSRSTRTRLCLAGSDGANMHVLLESNADRNLWSAAAQWRHDRVVVNVQGKPDERGLWTMSTSGANRTRIYPMPITAPKCLALSEHEVACADPSGICAISLSEGVRRQISHFGGAPAWSPDGKQIAFMRGDAELWLADAGDGRLNRLAWTEEPAGLQERYFGYDLPPRWSPDGRLLWFAITYTEARVPDPAWIAHLREELRRMEYPESEHDQMIQVSLEASQWTHMPYIGIVDFETKRGWSQPADWTEAEWSPSDD